MKQGGQWANRTEWVGCLASRTTLSLFKRNCFHTHGAQTGNKKCRAEPLSSHLTVYLVGRLVDSQLLEHSRKLLVANAALNHLAFYQLLRGIFPYLVRRCQSLALAWQCVHNNPPPSRQPSLVSCRYSLTTIFGRLRLIPTCEHYTFSAGYFLRTKMLRKTSTYPVGIQLPSTGGPT